MRVRYGHCAHLLFGKAYYLAIRYYKYILYLNDFMYHFSTITKIILLLAVHTTPSFLYQLITKQYQTTAEQQHIDLAK